jgi:hypothetical protein
VSVDKVAPKNIRKFSGGGPGMVTFEKSEVMRANPDRVKHIIEQATSGV